MVQGATPFTLTSPDIQRKSGNWTRVRVGLGLMEQPLLEEHSRDGDGAHQLANGGNQMQQQQRACGDGCGLADPEDITRRKAASRKLSIAIVFCLLFMLVEVGGGIMANSLAILTDAAHLLSDVASFAISLFAIYASSWDATPKQSYGFHRLEILGALVSIHIIWLITGILIYEAITRFLHNGSPVDGRLMFIIATLGLLVNIGMMLILGHGHGGRGHSHSHGGHSHSHGDHSHSHSHSHSGGGSEAGHNHDHEHGEDHEHDRRIQIRVDTEVDEIKGTGNSNKDNINVRGAYLHALGDLVQSVGVMIAGAIIWWKPEWKSVDLICTLLFSVLVLFTTVNMWREISEVLMESTPREIDATRLEEGLKKIASVQAVHELHIWAITLGKVLLACHVKIERDADADEVLRNVIDYCEREFKISHVTIQIERE